MAIYKRGREFELGTTGNKSRGTAGLGVRRADRSATLPSWRQNYNAVKKIKRLGREKTVKCLNFET